MSMPPHVLLALSPHGFGHGAMTAPIIERLRRLVPGLRLTIVTRLPRSWLEGRYEAPFVHVEAGREFGMAMRSATEVLVEESATAYVALHADLDGAIAEEAAVIAAAAPDLVLANIPYTTLAAAARLGVPAIGLSSLTWLGVYETYCGNRPEAAEIIAQMHAAYASAQAILRLIPAMPMTELPNVRDIGPVARLGRERRADLRRHLGVGEGTRVGLVAFGGVEAGIDFDAWPRHDGWLWISGQNQAGARPDVVLSRTLPFSFNDLMRSVDLLVGKPGYGTVAEAGCIGLPVVFARRDGWPEEPHLSNWLKRHARMVMLPAAQVLAGDIATAIAEVLAQPARPPAVASGIDEAAGLIAEALVRARQARPGQASSAGIPANPA